MNNDNDKLKFAEKLVHLSKSTNTPISYEDKGFQITIGKNDIKYDKSNYESTAPSNTSLYIPNDNDGESPALEDYSLHTVKSEIVGTIYLAPAPGEKPFVEVGSKVKKGESLCIIECMKVMNTLESDRDGEIYKIHVNNGDIVEYGQPLFAIKEDKIDL